MNPRADNWRPVTMAAIVRAERMGFTWLRDPARPGWRALKSRRGRQVFQILFQPLRRRRCRRSEFQEAA